MNEEIRKLAKECGGISAFGDMCFPDEGLKAFYRAAFNAGQKSQVKISIPTETMEQEFQTHFRRGFNAGLEAAAKRSDANKYGSTLNLSTGIMDCGCAKAIRALEMKP